MNRGLVRAVGEYLVAAILIRSGCFLPDASVPMRIVLGALGFAMIYFGGCSVFGSFKYSDGPDERAVRKFKVNQLAIVLLFFAVYLMMIVWRRCQNLQRRASGSPMKHSCSDMGARGSGYASGAPVTQKENSHESGLIRSKAGGSILSIPIRDTGSGSSAVESFLDGHHF